MAVSSWPPRRGRLVKINSVTECRNSAEAGSHSEIANVASFHRIPLDDELEKRKAEPQYSIYIIDLNTGTIAHWLRLDGTLVTEVECFRSAVRSPPAVGRWLPDKRNRTTDAR